MHPAFDPDRFAERLLASLSPATSLDAVVTADRDGITIGGVRRSWADHRCVSVCGLGKAALAQVACLVDRIDAARPPSVRRRAGLAVAPADLDPSRLDGLDVDFVGGSHPRCDAASRRAADRLLEWFAGREPDELVLFCLSGGGSALAETPRPPFRFEDQIAAFDAMLRAGTPIESFNLLRREMSAIKNGGLRAVAASADVVTLVTSDVPTDDLAVVSSGPTLYRALDRDAVRDAATRWLPNELATRVVAQLDGEERSRWTRRIAATARDDTAVRVADWRTALERAAALLDGFRVLPATSPANAPLDEALPEFLARFRAVVKSDPSRPIAVLSAGEWTVPLPEHASSGTGGRASEFVCRAALSLCADAATRSPDDARGGITVVGLATDGADGNSDAAGGWLDAATVARAAHDGVNLEQHLARHDTATYLARCGTAFRPGRTDTNLMDVQALLWTPRGSSSHQSARGSAPHA